MRGIIITLDSTGALLESVIKASIIAPEPLVITNNYLEDIQELNLKHQLMYPEIKQHKQYGWYRKFDTKKRY